MDASHLSLRHRQEQGFGVIEVLLILIVVVVLAGAGWYVWMREHKSTSSSQTGSNTTHGGNPAPTPNPAPDPYKGWRTYSNSQVSFKYPSDWAARVKQFTVAVATSPTFASGVVDTAANPGAPVDLFLQISTNSTTIDCADAPCQVSAVVPLSNPQLPGAELAVVNQTSGNGTKFTEYVVASSSTKAGDTSVSAVKAGNGNLYVFGQPEYNTAGGGVTAMEAGQITDVTAFQSDSRFQDLTKLIDSITFN